MPQRWQEVRINGFVVAFEEEAIEGVFHPGSCTIGTSTGALFEDEAPNAPVVVDDRTPWLHAEAGFFRT